MFKKLNHVYKLRIVALFSFFFCFLFQACSQNHGILLSEQNGGNTLIGSWSGKQKMAVRYQEGFMKFSFEKSLDSIETRMQIDKDGNVTGTVGGAKFYQTYVIKNRGYIMRKLNLATDFAIEGKLIGFLFPADTISIKPIAIPLIIKSGRLQGDIFQRQGMGVFPMSSLDLLNRN